VGSRILLLISNLGIVRASSESELGALRRPHFAPRWQDVLTTANGLLRGSGHRHDRQM
jgi:hypothetical protein